MGGRASGRAMTRSEVAEMHRLSLDEGLSEPAIADRVRRGETAVRRALASGIDEWPETAVRSVPPSPALSAAVRSEKARLRADLVAGRLTLADVLVPVHRCVANVPLAEVVRWQWSTAGRTAMPALEELGRLALGANVNLMMAAGRASGYSRAWVAEHGAKWARPANGSGGGGVSATPVDLAAAAFLQWPPAAGLSDAG